MTITIPSVEDIERAIERALDARGGLLQTEPFLGTDEAAVFLSTTPAAVRADVQRGKLPHHRAPGSRRLLFRASEIVAAVEAGGKP